MNFNSSGSFRYLILAGFFAVLVFPFSSCRSTGGSSTDTVSFPNISQFLSGQFRKMDSLGSGLTLWDTHKGISDSSRIRVEEARNLVAPFMGEDGTGGADRYSRRVLPDSSHHRTIVSYEAEGDSMPLGRIDVYLDSGSSDIRQLYLQYMSRVADSTIRLQLIWKTDREFTLIRTVEKNQYTADMRKQKVAWNLRP